MKITMKKRIVSALLAFAMVASFLPANLFPKAAAITFTSSTLKIESDGSFTAKFEGHTPDDGSIGTHYFALVPDIFVGASSGKTVSELSQLSGYQSYDNFKAGIMQRCGIDLDNEDVQKLCYIVKMDEDLYPRPDQTGVTVTGKIPDTSGFSSLFGKQGEGYQIPSTQYEDPEGNLQDYVGIPYVAVLFTGASPATVTWTRGDFQGAGLKGPLIYHINYADGGWIVDGDDKSEWRDTVNGTAYIEVPLKNLGAQIVRLARMNYISSDIVIELEGDQFSPDVLWADQDSGEFPAAGFFTVNGNEVGTVSISGNGEETLKIEIGATSMLDYSVEGEIQLELEYGVEGTTGTKSLPITIILTTVRSYWTYGDATTETGPLALTSNATVPYNPSACAVTGKLIWHGSNTTIGDMVTKVNNGTLEYFLGSVSESNRLKVGSPIEDGNEVIVRFTPDANKPGGVYPGGIGSITANNINADINTTLNVTAKGNTTVVVKRNGGTSWPSGEAMPNIELQLLDNAGNLTGSPLPGAYEASPANVWLASNGPLPSGEYEVLVGGKRTGVTVEVTYGSDASTTLHYYDIELAKKTDGGSATANLVAQSTTGNAHVATILANGSAAFNSHTISTTATPVANHTFTWTATNQGQSGDSTNGTGGWSDAAATTNTWVLNSGYTGAGPIVLDPHFSRTGVGADITVNLDTVGTNGLTVSISESTNGQGSGAKTSTTANGGKVRFDGLKPSTKYYVTVTTADYSGVYSFTTKAAADSDEVLNYYTVTAANGTGALNAAATAHKVLTGTTTTLSSAPDYAHGYGQTGSWTTTNPDSIGEASSISGTNAGAAATLLVKGKVTATANYTPNEITVEIYKNGVLETGGAGRTVVLKTTHSDSAPAAGSGGTGAAGKVVFSPVSGGSSTADVTYYIYVDDKDTGHTVACAPGHKATAKLYYYDVSFKDVTDATDHGHYTGTKPNTQEVLAGGPNNSVDLPGVAAVDANYDPTGWTMAPTASGDFKNTAGNTVTGSDKPGTGTATAAKWQIKDNYTAQTPGGIVLTPVFTPNGRYTATITVNLNGHTVADGAEVTLTPAGGGTAVKQTTTGGKATFVGLSGSYTVSVKGADESGTVVSFHSAASGDGSIPQVTASNKTPTLNFYQLTLTAGDHGSVNNTLNGVYYNQYPLAPTATAATAYHFVKWTVGTAAGGGDVPTHSLQNPVSGFKIGAETKWFANFGPNAVTLSDKTGAGTVGVALSVDLSSYKATTVGHSRDTYTYEILNAAGGSAVAGGTQTLSGITLTAGTNGYTISGTPTASGTFTFHVKATSKTNDQSDEATITITVVAGATDAPVLQAVTHTSVPGATDGVYKITNYTSFAGRTLEYTTDGGKTWTEFSAGAIAADGTVANVGAANYQVRVKADADHNASASSNTATIYGPAAAITLKKDGANWTGTGKGQPDIKLQAAGGTKYTGTVVDNGTTYVVYFTANDLANNTSYSILCADADIPGSVTAKHAINGPGTATVNYYTVKLGASTNGAGTINGGTDDVLVLVGASSTNKNKVTLANTPAANYILSSWKQEVGGTATTAGTFAGGYGSWTIGNYSGKGPITLTPIFTANGHNPKVVLRLDSTSDTDTGHKYTAKTGDVKLYQGTDEKYSQTLANGEVTFSNITPGTYDIWIDGVDTGVDVVTTNATTYVDYYTVKFDDVVLSHFQNNVKWAKITTAPALTAKTGTPGTTGPQTPANTNVSHGTPVLNGTPLIFTVGAWTADYRLTWDHSLSNNSDSKNNNVSTTVARGRFTDPVTATLTQNTHTISGTTERPNSVGSFADVQSVKYAAYDGATHVADLPVAYNTTNGTFSLAVPADFSYTLTADSKNWDRTLITGYKTSAATAEHPNGVSFDVTANDATNAAIGPVIVIDGALFKFILTHGDADNTEVTGKDWGSFVYGYTVNDASATTNDAKSQTVTIVNTGNRPLSGFTFTATGSGFTGASSITVTYPEGKTSIAPGEKATFVITPNTGLNVPGSPHGQTYTVTANNVLETDRKSYAAEIKVTRAPMDHATLTVPAPSKGGTPATTATKGNDGYQGNYTTKVTWTAGGSAMTTPTFGTNIIYEATVVLTPNNYPNHNYEFVTENSLNHTPLPDACYYKLNGAYLPGTDTATGSDGGTLKSVKVENGIVTLVYTFLPVDGGTPTGELRAQDFAHGWLQEMRVESSNAVTFHYVILPEGEPAPTDADAIKNHTVANSVLAGSKASTSASGGDQIWTGKEVFDGKPGGTYNLYVVSEASGKLSKISTAVQITLPKKLTVTVKGSTSASTTVKGSYPSIKASDGSNDTKTLDLNGTSGKQSSGALSLRDTANFTAAPGFVDNEVNKHTMPWALKSVTTRKGDADDAATADPGTTQSTSTTVAYDHASPVTQIDVTFRQRIVNPPVVSGTASLNGKLTATVGSGSTQVKIGDTNVTNFTSTGNFNGELEFQWQRAPSATSPENVWTNIDGANTFEYTVPAEYVGQSFRVRVTYTGDPAADGTTHSVVVSAGTQTQTVTLAKPEIELLKVEHSTDNEADMITDNGDLDKGGLYLLVTPVANADAADATYTVSLKRGTTALAGLNVTIDPENPDTSATPKWTTVTHDGVTKYAIRWPANWDDVRPGDNGNSNHNFTVTVKAVAAATGWASSPDATDTSLAGRRVLKETDLTGKFNDRRFNGGAQTGIGTSGSTATSDPVNGQIKTIDTLFQRDGGAQKGTAVGTIHIRYANTDPDGTTSTKSNDKIHVNMAEAATDKPWETTDKHDYYPYVRVDQGGLYLKLDEFAFALDTPEQDKDWKIYQSPTQIQGLQNKTVEQNKPVDLSTSNPKVHYQNASSGWVGTFPGETGTEYVTSQFDFTYTVKSLNGSTTPVEGTDYTLADDGKTFTPIAAGTFTIEVSATYKDSASDQFKADLAEPPVATFTVGGELGSYTAIQVNARREAVYGDATSAKSEPAPDPTTVIWYVTEDADGNVDADAAKYFSLEGIKVTETWSNGNQTYDLSTLEPENLVDLSKGCTAEKGADGKLRIKFDDAGGNERTVTFKVKNTHPAKNGAGGTGNVTQTSTGTVTLVLKARPLPYEVQAANFTGNEADFDWVNRTRAEKIWDGGNVLDGGDKARDGTPLKLRTVVTDAYALADSVTMNPNGYRSSSSAVGKDRTASAANAQPAGTYRLFYKTGAATNDKIDIYPALVTSVDVALTAPSTKTDESALNNSRYTPNTNTRTDEGNVNKNNWQLPVVTGTTQPSPVKWEEWDEATGDWVAMTGNRFQIEKVYKATVIIRADANHYLSDTVAGKPVTYSINGKQAGAKAFEDLESWLNRPQNTVTVTVDKDINATYDDPRTAPSHADWQPDEMLYNNTAVFTMIFHTFETPQLQFSDDKGVITTEDPRKGTDHTPSNYVHHTETVDVGASGMTYSIVVNAAVKDIYGAQVVMTNRELIDEAGATLSIEQGSGDPYTTTTPTRNMNLMYREENTTNYDPKQDLIIYTLNIPSSATARPGTYHLELQAMGSSSQENYESGRVDVAKSYYTFTLVVKERPQQIVSGGDEVELPMVTYMISSNGYTSDMTAEKISRKGGKPSFVPKITAMPGLKFVGWSETDPATLKEGKLPTLVDPLTFSINEDKIFYAVYEKDGYDHNHYVIGFPDGTFGPDLPITRAQVATIIARSCLGGFVEGYDYGNPGGYTDVPSKHWASSAIAFCTLSGAFNGYNDETFRPDRNISRQELATVVARLAGIQTNQGLPFVDSADVSGWALGGVYTAYANGWITGYKDGTFLPKNDITRAETVKIFNAYLNRGVNAEGLSDLTEYVHEGVASNNTENGSTEYMTWPDVPMTHWAYFEVIEAANDHNFHWVDQVAEVPPEHWEEAFINETWKYHDSVGTTVPVTPPVQQYTVSYDLGGHGTTWAALSELVDVGETPKSVPGVTPNEGYVFLGWSETADGTYHIDPASFAVTGDKTYYAIYEQTAPATVEYTITYDVGEHGTTWDATSETVPENTAAQAVPVVDPDEGYIFLGWMESLPVEGGQLELVEPTAIPVTGDKTYYAVCAAIQDPTISYTVTYELGDYGISDDPLSESVAENSPAAQVPAVTAEEGYVFLGWSETADGSALVDPLESPITGDKTYYAVYQEQGLIPEPDDFGSHSAYASGVNHSEFHPDEAITRGDVAAMLARLMNYDSSEEYDTSSLSDVEDHWARNAIGFCVEVKILSGYTDGTFLPDGTMTRQEFAVILSRLVGLETAEGELPFTDADEIRNWAKDAIYTAYVSGLMSGYTDGSFQPTRTVTRAETVKVFNAYLGRSADRDSILAQPGRWTDVPLSHWAYCDIMEASVEHNWYTVEGTEYWDVEEE